MEILIIIKEKRIQEKEQKKYCVLWFLKVRERDKERELILYII